ncbi:MAG TPA: efflux RND transporter periplasmic adaptor subunit [Steroidobacteraceae bacterium]|nr:efflux RND transporter periplasmic adaptor subunit [Steroidobacteraceae bacterium]
MTAATQRRVLWSAASIAVLLVLGVIVWLGRSSSPAVASDSMKDDTLRVSVLVPGLRPVTSAVAFTGSIAARYEMRIGPEGEGGRITGVFVEAGDRVERGQLLTKLDQSVVLAQVNSLQAALEDARAQLAWSQAEYKRAVQAGHSGAFSTSQTERLAAGALGDEAKVKVAAAQLAEARARLQRTEIRAPADGIVLTRNAEVGQTAAPGEALFRLAQGGEIEMRGQVAEQDLPRLVVGQSAVVQLAGVAQPFAGKIRLLGAVIDPQTRLGEVRIALQPHPMLRPGAFARGRVTIDSTRRAVLPQTAVLSDTKSTYVLIVNRSNAVERRNVRVAETIPEGIVIAEGLAGDERVVSTAGSFLREGEKVRVTEQG